MKTPKNPHELHKLYKNKKNRLTINFLDKRKREILIEGNRKAIELLGKMLVKLSKSRDIDEDACCLGLLLPGLSFFSNKTDLGLMIHRLPCQSRTPKPMGYSEKRERFKKINSYSTRYEDILKRILVLFPNQIKVTGRPTPNDGYFSPSFNEALEDVESQVYDEDTIGSLMLWSIHQVFHKEAKRLHKIKKTILYPRQVNKPLIKKRFFENLKGAGFSKERRRVIP